MRIATIAIVALLTGGVLAQDATDLRHPTARKALIRAEQETRRAEQVYRQELLRIQKALVSELEQAKADAMRRQMLDEANAIQQAIDAARQELDRLEGKPVVQTFEIDAAQSWQPTVEVAEGQVVTIRARGMWCGDTRNPRQTTCGPDGMTKGGELVYYLEGRVGDGQAFRVGNSARFTAPASGTLSFRMSDGNHTNNSGSVTVAIGLAQ